MKALNKLNATPVYEKIKKTKINGYSLSVGWEEINCLVLSYIITHWKEK
jgi:hypothetical protein